MINHKRTINNESLGFAFLVFVGIAWRFCVLTLGHNFDWESYCIVGDIVTSGGNVYAQTYRYNYGPFFSMIQGLLYRISTFAPADAELLLYRVLMVLTLTLADLGIAFFIGRNYSMVGAIVFFLNPVSIVITGYHNQFDNIAILFALISTLYYNEEESFSKKDGWFVFWLTLCLITKHILFLIPIFLIFKKNLPIKKKLVYTVLPPFLFLCSFIPFCIDNLDALHGIVNNVFLYRSFNNAPLMNFIYKLVGFPDGMKFFVYIGLMCLLAYCLKGLDFENSIYMYLIAMVAFSSAIANQYLAIPLAALCILNTRWFKYIYMGLVGCFLILHTDGLGLIRVLKNNSLLNICDKYIYYGYTVATWILFITLLYILWKDRGNIKDKQ